MLELIQKVILMVGLFLCAWKDAKRQQIYIVIPCLAGAAGFVMHIILQDFSLWEMLAGMAVGILCLLISLGTKESIGYGDGIVFMFTGIFLGFWGNVSLFLTTLFLTGIAALFFIILKRKGRKDRMPVVPFVLAAYVLNLL